jgi:hypothetical protein
MRAFDVGRHDADLDVFLDHSAVGPESYQTDDVRRLVGNIDVVVGSRGAGCDGESDGDGE